MYPNPLINVHSGVYIKVDPISESNVEVFELRPDLYISWAAIPILEGDYFEDLQFRGIWVVDHSNLTMNLTDEDEQDVIQVDYELNHGIWVSVDNPNVYLRKRSGMEALEGPFYFDIR